MLTDREKFQLSLKMFVLTLFGWPGWENRVVLPLCIMEGLQSQFDIEEEVSEVDYLEDYDEEDEEEEEEEGEEAEVHDEEEGEMNEGQEEKEEEEEEGEMDEVPELVIKFLSKS